MPGTVVTNNVVIVSGEDGRTEASVLSYTLHFEMMGIWVTSQCDSGWCSASEEACPALGTADAQSASAPLMHVTQCLHRTEAQGEPGALTHLWENTKRALVVAKLTQAKASMWRIWGCVASPTVTVRLLSRFPGQSSVWLSLSASGSVRLSLKAGAKVLFRGS